MHGNYLATAKLLTSSGCHCQ